MYYDSGDEGDGAYTERRIPALTNRTKIAPTDSNGNEPRFWVAFDNQVMQKSMIELLNISLSKFAHHRVAVLNTASIDKATAESKLLPTTSSTPSSPSPPSTTESRPTKRSHAAMENADVDGFFAYFFPVNDLDMIWRSVLHGHLLNRRFGELLEFRSASCATTKKRDFDELVNIYTHLGRLPSLHRQQLAATGLSTEVKCCLLLPCSATSTDMFRVGKNVHSLLNINGSLYFRANATLSDKEISEVSFRGGATHRIRREESTPDAAQSSVLGYQPPKKVEYVLQPLDDLSDNDHDDDE
ncbi:hypothetical protein AC1031_004680 [Aphanomyces cochlioides]|nr:hypothetical protein AC1031_004680 [Aphanomyces cochlioides]